MSQFFSNEKFNSVNADIELHDGMSLTDFGLEATVVATPEHTPGSVSIVTAQGDAIIGDLIMGGYMGGRVLPTQPNYHYFADNIAEAMSSLDVILSQTKHTLYAGYGGPLSHAAVNQWRQQHSES
ncbi:MAG: hypothetical protein HLUCCA11_22765 [Phormidesmis priestleyi Ana]|uniref:Zn-dependent hydrolase n=1 Tax=Phormidesmis priestleyi Ana TaxID=1666911 RepID=A0A0P7YNK4_9CYAN|nr:MAG: hypothetical protein HLUCCA11_22765 [Phormidesmis priestleyi Ana]